jgi:hypothetical protein
MASTVSLRQVDGSEHVLPLERVLAADVLGHAPWRTFRSHRSQRHYSGWYWSSTMGQHVVYESRLELARLLLADINGDITGIAAQPFLLAGTDGSGRVRRHVPDFFLTLSDGSSLVVNVKPAEKLNLPPVAGVLEWANHVFEAKGWRTEVWSGANPVLVANVRFLAGYWRRWLFDQGEAELAWRSVRSGDTIGDAELRLRSRGVVDARPLLLHLLWAGRLVIDLTQPIESATRLERNE